MCLVHFHKSSKSAPYEDITGDYYVPARIVPTDFSSTDEKHQQVRVINTPTSRRSSVQISSDEKRQQIRIISPPMSRRSSVHIQSDASVVSSHSPPLKVRVSRRSTMSGGPARASYISARGTPYYCYTEKQFYGRDSGEPLILTDETMGSADEKSLSDNGSETSATGCVIVQH